MIGVTLGHYKVGDPLGRGGMGEVFRASDLSLGREVALKFLPDLFTSDPERMARFEREARLMASLNHPNIAAIYGLEAVEGKRFLVLECIEGETLAQRIVRGPLQVEDALDICRQIAEGVEAAHNKGVLHRDLKPSNVKITPEGKVKVLDFGLAKALGDEVHESPPPDSFTQAETMTRPGVILGTTAYMSPEQAKGRAIDKRTDIWALGCILYECLTGKRAFAGETTTEILGAVLKDEPDWEALPSATPPGIRIMLRRCLQKDPDRRIRDAGDLRIEIEESKDAHLAPSAVASRAPRRLGHWVLLCAAILAVLAVLADVGLRYLISPASGKIVRSSFVLPEDQEFFTSQFLVAISPDGSSFVYAANGQLYLRRLSELETRPISGTNLGAMNPFFSPDGQWVGFWSVQESAIKKVPITGGTAVTLCNASPPSGVSWHGDTIVFSQDPSGILAVSANGGTPEVWVQPQTGEVTSSPEILPGGNAVLFAVLRSASATSGASSSSAATREIVVYSRAAGKRTVLVQGGVAPRYLASGRLIYAVGSNLMMVPFNLERLEVTGGPVPVLEDAAGYAISEDGTLIYVPGSPVSLADNRVLVLADRTGKHEVLGLPSGTYQSPRLSKDGKQLALQINDEGGNIWIYDLSGKNALRRLTFEGSSSKPIWSPDGRQLAYFSNRGNKPGIYLQAADGRGIADEVTGLPSAVGYVPNSWSPDGKTLLFSAQRMGNDYGLWTIPLEGERKAEQFFDVSPSIQGSAAFSPDGRWVAYISAESGRFLVYVRPFPKTGGSAKYQISRETAIAPVWSPDGKELFYFQVDSQRIAAVPIRTDPAFSFGQPVPLPIKDIVQGSSSRQFDIMPDGKRFLGMMQESQTGEKRRPTQRIILVQNWLEELRQRSSGR